MGNTNTELERRIAELERITEKFSQTSQPTNGRAEGQLFYDRSTDSLKVWNGNSWESASAGASYYANVYSKPSSTGTLAYSGFGFKPKMVMVEALVGMMRSSTVWIDGGYKGGLSLYLNSYGNLISRETTGIVDIEDDTPAVDIYSYATGISMDSDGITLNWITVDIPCRFTIKAFG